MSFGDFRGRAKRLDDVDLCRLGHALGVGEDEVHSVLEVESRGSGFDKQGRPAMLFEPHIFWRELGDTAKRQRAAAQGLAYPSWRSGAYPKDSYPRLVAAIAIDETAALRSASWGLGQVMGFNHKLAGYISAAAMVRAFMDDEEAHLEAMITFIKACRLDDELRRHDWAGFARGYNGECYAKHDYHGRLARAFAKWQRIKDTPWSPAQAAFETKANDPAAPDVVFPPSAALPPIGSSSPAVGKADPHPAAPAPRPGSGSAAPTGFWGRFLAALRRPRKEPA
jgi:hypothetical protein